ncbi:MAG: hypothetical protein CMM44_05400 [Rhodospirillaceae bacterium]|nr:hypothetical protein [Rhodospirillaceae bacterium]|tara:strand:+ start:1260 stop:1775 length:516 start_codon:yes stop_codon:yes gene_type:complete
MNLETGLVLVALIWGAWVLMKIHRRRQQINNPIAPIIGSPKKTKKNEMPRLGKPGTLTYNQIKELQKNNFEPDRNWSIEEANLILDAVKYLRCVCRDVANAEVEKDPPIEIQNELLRFILTEQDIREHVRKWGDTGRLTGKKQITVNEPPLEINNQYKRVKELAIEFFSDE